jgi:CcmD family protein
MALSSTSGSIEWVMVVNLIIWTGLFLYLRRLDRKVRALEAFGASEPLHTRERQP